jgi:MFS family permease
MMPALDAGSESAAYPSPARAWWVVGLLFVAAIISYSDRQVISLVVDPIRRDLGISDVQIGLLIGTAFALIYGLAGIPLGYLADRTSRRNLIAGGMITWSIATILCGCVRTFDEMFAARVLVGLGEAILSPAAVSLISDLFPPERRGAALGVYFTGVSIGIGSAVVIGGALLSGINAGLAAATPLAHLPPWRSVLILIGMPGVLWALLMLTFREPARHRPSDAASSQEAVSAQAESSHLNVLRGEWWRPSPIFVVVAMAAFIDNAIAAWAPSLLIRNFHLDTARIGVTLGMVFMIGGAVGMITGGLLSDRARRRFGWPGRVYVCLAASLMVMPLLFLITSSRVTLILIAILAIFFASAWITSSGLAAILDWAPNNRRGLATSISFFFNVAVGLGAGPPAVALTARYFSDARGSLAPSMQLVAAAGYVVAAVGACAALYLVRRSGAAESTRGVA